MLTRKHFLKSLLAVAALSSFTAVNAQTTGKTLVVYYSWSGNTRAMAQAIAKELQADIYEIKPIKPYPESYRATVNQARDELQRGFRPEIEKTVPDLSQYSTIVLGSPNWWSHLSMPVFSFIDQNDLSGKVILPFVTHGGGGMSSCEDDIRAKFPKADVREGITAYGSSFSVEDIRAWLKKNGLLS